MKLSKEQIAKIDETLVLNKVVYDDIKLELTDHIASDIEEIMVNQEISFGVALKEAFEKWRLQLKPRAAGFWTPEKRRFLFSERTVEPKLIMDKLEKISKKNFFNIILLSIIITSLTFALVKMYDSETVLNAFNEVCKSLCLILIALLLSGRILMFKIKGATTFGYLFKTEFFRIIWMPFFNLFLLSDTDFLLKPISNKHFFIIALFALGLVRALLSLQFLYKHFEFERKLSKV